MHRLLVKEGDVDLSVPPCISKRVMGCCADLAELTMGDLHANAMKFIFFLVTEGVFKVSPDVYMTLWDLYQTPMDQVTEETFTRFEAILRDDVSVLRKGTLVRLIGDELSDRGENDFFVLMIFEALVLKGVQFEILFSNHGAEFLNHFNYIKKHFAFSHSFICVPSKMTSYAPQIDPLFTNSSKRLKISLEEGLINVEELSEKVDNFYVPHIKLISFSLDKSNNEITIFSHAPIDLADIKGLALYFDVPYNDGSIVTFGEMIDAINGKAKPDQLYPHCSPYHFDKHVRFHPIYRCAWNRYLTDLNRPAIHRNGFKMHWVHGHDPLCESNDHITNLDNELGKCPGNYKGEYTALIVNQVIANLVHQLPRMPSRAFFSYFFEDNDTLDDISDDDLLSGSFRPFTEDELGMRLDDDGHLDALSFQA